MSRESDEGEGGLEGGEDDEATKVDVDGDVASNVGVATIDDLNRAFFDIGKPASLSPSGPLFRAGLISKIVGTGTSATVLWTVGQKRVDSCLFHRWSLLDASAINIDTGICVP